MRDLLTWLGVWTVVGLILMYDDKDRGVTQGQMGRNDRISERTLLEERGLIDYHAWEARIKETLVKGKM